eukprot:6172822-Pleurochrysis_carterae.AAC.1
MASLFARSLARSSLPPSFSLSPFSFFSPSFPPPLICLSILSICPFLRLISSMSLTACSITSSQSRAADTSSSSA